MKNLRTILRWTHILGAAVLGTYIYSPWSSDPSFTVFVQAFAFPALLTVTGVVMWQQGRLKKLLRKREPATGGSHA